MKWTVTMKNSVQRRYAMLPRNERDRILRALKILESGGPYINNLDIKPLVGRPEWRLRVGDWRILFRIENEIITIVVVGLDARGDVYKK